VTFDVDVRAQDAEVTLDDVVALAAVAEDLAAVVAAAAARVDELEQTLVGIARHAGVAQTRLHAAPGGRELDAIADHALQTIADHCREQLAIAGEPARPTPGGAP
jgi:hypothetical protein